jgi:signal transduction histidine kinase
MQPDSQFVDNYVAAVQDEQSAETLEVWVNERLAQDFMRNAAATMRSGVLVIVLIIFLLYDHANTLGLVFWAVASILILGYRRYTLHAFAALMDARAISGRNADIPGYFRRHGWSWPVSACIFSLPIVFYHAKVPLAIEYLCVIILVGIGATGASLMAANLKCQRGFSHALAITAMAAIVINWFIQWPAWPKRESMVFLLSILLFWALMLYLGKHLHHLQRNSYSAQYGNEQLIRSLRQQTQAATEAVQTKNNLLASATHDLRQPVHALAFYADWLRNEPELADRVIPKILAATDSVNTLFNSLFDFARIEAGAIQVNRTGVDISMLIEEMAVQFAPAADAKGLSLRTQPLQATVHSDPVLLRRITANLLANAIRYTEKGGVVLAARISGDKLWLEISDSGPGISPEHLPHVFKEFYRAPIHEGTADSFGLGLAIVQRLSRALGHVVTLRSELGQGTRARLEMQWVHAGRDSQASGAVALFGQTGDSTIR